MRRGGGLRSAAPPRAAAASPCAPARRRSRSAARPPRPPGGRPAPAGWIAVQGHARRLGRAGFARPLRHLAIADGHARRHLGQRAPDRGLEAVAARRPVQRPRPPGSGPPGRRRNRPPISRATAAGVSPSLSAAPGYSRRIALIRPAALPSANDTPRTTPASSQARARGPIGLSTQDRIRRPGMLTFIGRPASGRSPRPSPGRRRPAAPTVRRPGSLRVSAAARPQAAPTMPDPALSRRTPSAFQRLRIRQAGKGQQVQRQGGRLDHLRDVGLVRQARREQPVRPRRRIDRGRAAPPRPPASRPRQTPQPHVAAGVDEQVRPDRRADRRDLGSPIAPASRRRPRY